MTSNVGVWHHYGWTYACQT